MDYKTPPYLDQELDCFLHVRRFGFGVSRSLTRPNAEMLSSNNELYYTITVLVGLSSLCCRPFRSVYDRV
jgi:hypothetical protein